MVGQLLLVPAHADAQHDAPARHVIEGGDRLGQREQVVLERQRDPGGEPQPLGGTGRHGEADERVHHPRVLRRHLTAGRVGRASRHGDVRVLADPQRLRSRGPRGAGRARPAGILRRVHRGVAELHAVEYRRRLLRGEALPGVEADAGAVEHRGLDDGARRGGRTPRADPSASGTPRPW